MRDALYNEDNTMNNGDQNKSNNDNPNNGNANQNKPKPESYGAFGFPWGYNLPCAREIKPEHENKCQSVDHYGNCCSTESDNNCNATVRYGNFLVNENAHYED